MSAQEITDTLKGVDYKKTDRLIMIGVLASLKTLQGLDNKFLLRYPRLLEISNIFQENENHLNLIHYSSKELNLAQLFQIEEIAGNRFNGFQLNTAWPDPSILNRFKVSCPGKIISLFIGEEALEKIDYSPEKLSKKINNEYAGLIDYVLLNPNGCTGKDFDPIVTRCYLEELNEYQNYFGLGVSGNFSSSTINLVEPIINDFPNISISAEGKSLRTLQDNLDIQKASLFVEKSEELFCFKY